MNNQVKYKEDLLKQYINPERRENAPEEFTEKVMSRIKTEAVPHRHFISRLVNKSLVPFVSAAVTIVLVVAAFLVSGSGNNSFAFPVAEHIKNFRTSLPEIDLSSVFRHNLPASFLYVLIAILILTLFDRALYIVFHKEK